MSLFRTAVVLSLGVAVMPSDPAQQAALYERAATTAHWTMTYCDRNGAQCQLAGALWETFLAKAQFAGKLAYDVAIKAANSDVTVPQGVGPSPASAQGTLAPDDLRPAWRAGANLNGA
jgi:hypothetical protein